MADEQNAPQVLSGQPLKRCKGCKTELPHGDFYPLAGNRDGMTGKCKACICQQVRDRRVANPEFIAAYERKRQLRPERRVAMAENVKRWNKENPLGYVAHYTLGNAVRDGRVKKEPCLFCSAVKVHAHHQDYAKPLEVVWLCARCHTRLHAKFPETQAKGKGA